MADGQSLSSLADDDVYALCGNILDNAVNALSAISPVSERLLVLTIKTQGELLLIHEENPFVGSLAYADGLPLTTQENENYAHGFGTASIRRIVENYRGTLYLHDRDGWFYVDIAIPLPSEDPANAR
ncbi:GHKL domain-containing protein [Alloscardovia macacae]